jgi:hypothetical protein
MTELILQPGPAEGIDTYINAFVSTNFGAGSAINIGNYISERSSHVNRALFRFALSSVPGGSNILSAVLTLYNNGDDAMSHTIRCYRCPTAWTELGATWTLYDGANAWPVNGTGGDWDASIVCSDAVGVGEDAVIDITALVVDAMENRDGELNLLLKTDELVDEDRIIYYSSDETTETTKRPKLVIDYVAPAGGIPSVMRSTLRPTLRPTIQSSLR